MIRFDGAGDVFLEDDILVVVVMDVVMVVHIWYVLIRPVGRPHERNRIPISSQ